jgi:hypothetical protein
METPNHLLYTVVHAIIMVTTTGMIHGLNWLFTVSLQRFCTMVAQPSPSPSRYELPVTSVISHLGPQCDSIIGNASKMTPDSQLVFCIAHYHR